MLVLVVLAILQVAFVINKPILNLLCSPDQQEFDPELSARRLDTLYHEYETLRAKKQTLKPTWVRKEKQVTKGKEMTETNELPEGEEMTETKGVTEAENEPLINTQEIVHSVASGPWMKMVKTMPSEFNPISWAIKLHFGEWATDFYKRLIIKEETKILSKLADGYDAMWKGSVREAETFLKDAIYLDGLSHSITEDYYKVNAPVIKFEGNRDYMAKRHYFDAIPLLLDKAEKEDLASAFRIMLKDRKEMEKRWESGKKILPDPTNLVLDSDTVPLDKKKAVDKATSALAHEISGFRYHKERNKVLAKFHHAAAKELYAEAETTMEKVYGRQFGAVDLKTHDYYYKKAQELETTIVPPNNQKIGKSFEGSTITRFF